MRRVSWLLLIVLVLQTLLIVGMARSEERLTGQALIDRLAGGGYVLYLSHPPLGPAAADASDARTAAGDAAARAAGVEPGDGAMDECSTGTILSKDERDRARMIGIYMRAHGILGGPVLTSPDCRAVEAADIAFGRHETRSTLTDLTALKPEQWTAATIWLRDMLATRPQPGLNTVLIAPEINLIMAAAVRPINEGDLVVFRAVARDRFVHVGTLAPRRSAAATAGNPAAFPVWTALPGGRRDGAAGPRAVPETPEQVPGPTSACGTAACSRGRM